MLKSFAACLLVGTVTSLVATSAIANPVNIGNALVTCGDATPDLTGVDAMRNYKGKSSWQPNIQWAAGLVASYAAASYDAYEDVRPASAARALRLDDENPDVATGGYGLTGWRRFVAWNGNGRTDNLDNGLRYDVYYRDASSKQLDLMIAFRGTVGAQGWIANFSWITQWFHRGQYEQAQEEFPEIVQLAQSELAKGRAIAITTTGHSLGGGLARHVAMHYQCTSAVVFNASFVTNTLNAEFTPPIQVFVYEKGDYFERLVAGNVKNTRTDATYRLSVSDIPAKHNMERLAVGRLVWP